MSYQLIVSFKLDTTFGYDENLEERIRDIAEDVGLNSDGAGSGFSQRDMYFDRDTELTDEEFNEVKTSMKTIDKIISVVRPADDYAALRDIFNALEDEVANDDIAEMDVDDISVEYKIEEDKAAALRFWCITAMCKRMLVDEDDKETFDVYVEEAGDMVEEYVTATYPDIYRDFETWKGQLE